MVTRFDKGSSTKLSEHFSTDDFDCHCNYDGCLTTYVDSALIDALEFLYTLTGGFSILSGFRCTQHNEDVDGKPGSQHLQGKAADCKPKQLVPHAFAVKCDGVSQFRSGGVGTYPTFVHVDVRGYPARWKVARKLNAVSV